MVSNSIDSQSNWLHVNEDLLALSRSTILISHPRSIIMNHSTQKGALRMGLAFIVKVLLLQCVLESHTAIASSVVRSQVDSDGHVSFEMPGRHPGRRKPSKSLEGRAIIAPIDEVNYSASESPVKSTSLNQTPFKNLIFTVILCCCCL